MIEAGAPLSPPTAQGLWNPALLASHSATRIQPNDLSLGGSGTTAGGGNGGGRPQPSMLLLTGANTGGKSTLLRAACLAAVMAQASRLRRPGMGTAGHATLVPACERWFYNSHRLRPSLAHLQIGCYVPCSRAELAPVDRIFTRVGKPPQRACTSSVQYRLLMSSAAPAVFPRVSSQPTRTPLRSRWQ